MRHASTRFRGLVAASAATLLAAGCGRGDASTGTEIDTKWSPTSLSSIGRVPIAEVRSAIAERLEADRPAQIGEDPWGHTARLYLLFRQNPLWMTEDGLHSGRAEALTKALMSATSDGLQMEAYPISELATALAALHQSRRPTATELAHADVMLTAAYAALGEDLLTGQIEPRAVSQSWHIDPMEENVDSALVRILRSESLDAGIATMRPRDPDYEALRQELSRLRQLAARGGWMPIPEGKALKSGDRDNPARIAALRNRLAAEGIRMSEQRAQTREQNAPDLYDAGLAAGVAEFQRRHGIVVDSVLGAATVKSLNVPAAFRLGQVAANLERHRWLPRTLGSRYILVNVPAFRLDVYESGQRVLDMKVIVGAEYENRATPVFSDSMQYVVFRPYWFVPPSIAANEIFPRAASDPGYFSRNNYEIWYEGGERRVRQRPGDDNSLGLVKFMFPNDFNIYLHDTPQSELFEEDIRAFSHGCIRVEKPEQLAQYVLGWSPEQVRQSMTSGRNDRRVNLRARIPVYIAYFTAYMKDGQLHFASDLYDRDRELIRAVSAGALPSRQAVQAVEALGRIAAR